MCILIYTNSELKNDLHETEQSLYSSFQKTGADKTFETKPHKSFQKPATCMPTEYFNNSDSEPYMA